MPDDPKLPSPPEAAGDKPPSDAPAEPIKGEVSRISSPGAGASAAHPAAEKPAAPAAEKEKPAAAVKPPPRPAAQATAGAAPAPKEHETKVAPPAGPPDPAPPADAAIPGFITELQQKLSDVATQVSYWVGDWTVIVPADRLLDVARHLRDSPGARFDYLSDLTASDWPPRAKRFDVVYCLYSTTQRQRLRVKVQAGEGDPVPSVTGLWPAANWLEREVYDLFGVNFVGHPDRRRILMPDEWQGHPQRKDYPLEGPGELLMENPLDWLRLRNARDTVDIE